jgi:hypothetical protein
VSTKARPSQNGHAHKSAKPPPAPPADGDNGAAARGLDPVTGHFLPGNKLGKGNPHYRKLAAARSAFLEVVGPAQVKQLAADLLRRALDGDLDAARLVLAYGVGRPGPAADPDAQDADELRRLLARPLEAQVTLAALAVEPARALEFLAVIAQSKRGKPLLPEDEDDDGPEAIGRAVVLCQLREQILQARARTT